jgi:hypothetical protein
VATQTSEPGKEPLAQISKDENRRFSGWPGATPPTTLMALSAGHSAVSISHYSPGSATRSAQLAAIHYEIVEMPMGCETMVAEGVDHNLSSLSGTHIVIAHRVG